MSTENPTERLASALQAIRRSLVTKAQTTAHHGSYVATREALEAIETATRTLRLVEEPPPTVPGAAARSLYVLRRLDTGELLDTFDHEDVAHREAVHRAQAGPVLVEHYGWVSSRTIAAAGELDGLPIATDTGLGTDEVRIVDPIATDTVDPEATR